MNPEKDMNRDPAPDPSPDSALVLPSRFRLGELERTISSRRFLLGTLQWLYIPCLSIALVVMVAGLILGWGSFVPVLGGTVAISGAVLSLLRKASGLREDLVDLEAERDSMAAAIQSGTEGNIGQINA